MMRQRRLKNEINVVPYIDVMLVLLVIFWCWWRRR
jgi:biopolymer transport protein TolR